MTLEKELTAYVPCCEQERGDRRMMLACLKERPDILKRSDEMAHFTASAWVVDPTRTKALMIYHNIYNSWAWTGGHTDGEADLLGVALREVREETGLEDVRPICGGLFSLEILTVNGHFKRGKYVLPHLHLNLTYLLEADDRQPLRSKPDENSDVKWFSLEDAVAASTEPALQTIYTKLNRKLKEIKETQGAI